MVNKSCLNRKVSGGKEEALTQALYQERKSEALKIPEGSLKVSKSFLSKISKRSLIKSKRGNRGKKST